MDLLSVFVLVAAVILFILSGFTVPRGNPPGIHLGWFGMAALAVFLGIQLL